MSFFEHSHDPYHEHASEVHRWMVDSVYDNGAVAYDGYDPYAKKDPESLDYSILSVAVMTLGLILVVEVVRHRLDKEAAHRPFFKVVLEATYSELATLGLVELFIFLLLRYYQLKNKERKDVFAEVHFALFYTAIFNAFQSVLCGFFTRRVSNSMWVRTEQLELDHYVEIREAFDKVSDQYYSIKEESQRTWLSNAFSFLKALRTPGLRRRYLNLLVQVRFHELRIHFLENNNLPLTLKVSDYLKRAEESVLMHMVHVSKVAWVMLTAVFNLIYFLMGLLANRTGDPDLVAATLATIFFGALLLFILICIVLYFKMHSIFRQILKMEHINEYDLKAGADQQRSLFWFNEPNVVIALIQFMQFGYAIALSIIIMFRGHLGEVELYWYFLATLGCYSIFVWVLAKVLPQYTLCTSLGHLVNKEHLNDTLALYRLQEAKRKRKRKMVELTFADDLDESIICMGHAGADVQATGEVGLGKVGEHGGSRNFPIEYPSSSLGIDTPIAYARAPSADDLIASSEPTDSAIRDLMPPLTDQGTSTLLADLVKMDTQSLRAQLPEREQMRLNERDQRRANRKKSVSDGVQNMISLTMGQPGVTTPAWSLFGGSNKDTQSKTGPLGSNTTPKAGDSVDNADDARNDRARSRRENRKKAMTASGVIKSWRNVDQVKKTDNQVTAKDDSVLGDKAPLNSRRRHHNRKSSSASEAVNMWQDDSSLGPKFTLKENVIVEKTSQDPAKLHQLLRAQRMSARRANIKKAVTASAIIQSWQDHSISLESTTPVQNNGLDPEVMVEGYDPEEHGRRGENAELAISKQADDSNVIVVDLSDANLVDDENQKENGPIKKSVGFSDDLDDKSLDSFIGPKKTDDDTIDTGKSVGELSDVGVVSRSDFESLRSLHHKEPWHVKLRQRLSPRSIKKVLHGYFMSDANPVLSHVFGTVVVCFLIGMRLESFNAVSGAYPKSYNTWELRIEAAFWWQATWYMLFLVGSVASMWAVHPSECKSIPEKRVYMASAADLVLSGLCLTLLLVAEHQRCCDDETIYDNVDFQAEDNTYQGGGYNTTSSYVTDPYEKVAAIDPSYYVCCPSWGKRTYGGYGAIEPWTALICCRVLRWQFGKYAVKMFHRRRPKQEESRTDEHVSDDHGHGPSTGTIVQLWQRAILAHPDIAQKYGQFSAELFQAMLGMDIVDQDSMCRKRNFSSTPQTVTPSGSGAELKELEEKDISSVPHYKLSGDQYTSLSTEAQGLILAGKLGKPVKSMLRMGSMLSHESTGSLPTLLEEGGVEAVRVPRKLVLTDVEFEVDTDLLAEEEEAESMFVAPNARLTRSMRRCDRRLLPLLKDWVTVDVVITDYEIVYFEVQDEVEENLPAEIKQRRDALRQALQVTNGGKGLRLMDVAAGRNVVGHLALPDVTEVHVQREMPLPCASQLEANEANMDVSHQVASEYWFKPSHVEVHTASRELRWAKVKEDQLKIVSNQGTLCLRFYSDLNNVEAHKEESEAENEFTGSMKIDIAFQWAQTVARICGQQQLKQPLPNFGTGDSDELRDYLQIVYQKTDEKKHQRIMSSITSRAFDDKRHHRRFSSFGLGPSSHGSERSQAIPVTAANSRPQVIRSKSFNEEKPKGDRLLLRSASIGEDHIDFDIEAEGERKVLTNHDLVEDETVNA